MRGWEAKAAKRKPDLYALDNPRGLPVSAWTSLIEAFGFVLDRQRGSHRRDAREDVRESVNLPPRTDGNAETAQGTSVIGLVEGERPRQVEDDGSCSVVPDMPGCTAHGETPEEAFLEAHTTQELWLKTTRDRGWPIPRPSRHPALVRTAEDRAGPSQPSFAIKGQRRHLMPVRDDGTGLVVVPPHPATQPPRRSSSGHAARYPEAGSRPMLTSAELHRLRLGR